jgi:hypothetical protein
VPPVTKQTSGTTGELLAFQARLMDIWRGDSAGDKAGPELRVTGIASRRQRRISFT